jgi:hypothetical protein
MLLMIVIQQGQPNTVVLTLTEKCTLSAPVFLFEFSNDESKGKQYFIAADTSAFTYRYNQFVITEKSDPDNLQGEVSLPLSGYYHYTIYEQSSATNLDPNNTVSIVETGKVKVIGTEPQIITYDSQPGTKTIYKS